MTDANKIWTPMPTNYSAELWVSPGVQCEWQDFGADFAALLITVREWGLKYGQQSRGATLAAYELSNTDEGNDGLTEDEREEIYSAFYAGLDAATAILGAKRLFNRIANHERFSRIKHPCHHRTLIAIKRHAIRKQMEANNAT